MKEIDRYKKGYVNVKRVIKMIIVLDKIEDSYLVLVEQLRTLWDFL